MTKSELYNGVCRIKEYLDICDESYPIDMFELCRKIYGLEVEKVAFKTKDLRGMLCVANDSSENSVIIVNSNKSLVEQNYHCAHEFMHLFNDAPAAGTIIRCFDKLRPNQNRYVEWLANEGAAELLVPYKMLLPMIKDKYSYIDSNIFVAFDFCQKQSRLFNVSAIVLINRLGNLKYEIHQYLNGTPIEQINILSKTEQDRQNIIVKSLIEIEDERFKQLYSRREQIENQYNNSVSF